MDLSKLPADVEHPDGLLKSLLELPADRHHFADGFHLSSDDPACALELLEIPPRNLDSDVVQCRLEARGGRPRNLVPELGEGIADRQLCRYVSNGISRRLAGKGRAAREAGV